MQHFTDDLTLGCVMYELRAEYQKPVRDRPLQAVVSSISQPDPRLQFSCSKEQAAGLLVAIDGLRELKLGTFTRHLGRIGLNFSPEECSALFAGLAHLFEQVHGKTCRVLGV